MTNEPTINDQLQNDWENYRKASGEANAINKTAVFAALADAQIAHVSVPFDGEGDSGQLAEPVAYRADSNKPVEFPAAAVTFRRIRLGSIEITVELSLYEAIEQLCYDYLEEAHGGWEINDGSFGEFSFDVRVEQITLDFNGRFTDYSHEVDRF